MWVRVVCRWVLLRRNLLHSSSRERLGQLVPPRWRCLCTQPASLESLHNHENVKFQRNKHSRWANGRIKSSKWVPRNVPPDWYGPKSNSPNRFLCTTLICEYVQSKAVWVVSEVKYVDRIRDEQAHNSLISLRKEPPPPKKKKGCRIKLQTKQQE